jgi:DNA adenine methylase
MTAALSSTARQTWNGMLNSPIRWVGGKSRIRKAVIPLIPSHSCYVEVFGGAGWVLFGKPPSDVEIFNDIDGELVNFFRVLQSSPHDLAASFKWELVSRAEFERLAALDPGKLDSLERAHRFYYLIMAGWGGESNYPRFSTSISDGGHGNRLIGALNHLETKLLPIHDRLRNVIIEDLDWRECIDRYDTERTVMYLDPPYPQNGANYLHNMRDWKEHEALARRLAEAKCRWILSSYDNSGVREMYADYTVASVGSVSGMEATKNGGSRVPNEEVLVLNFDLPTSSARKSQHTLDPQE